MKRGRPHKTAAKRLSKVVSLKLPADLAQEVADLAEASMEPASHHYRRAIRLYLADAKRPTKTPA